MVSETVLPHMVSFARCGESLRLTLEASGGPVAHVIDYVGDVEVRWSAYARDASPLYVCQLVLDGVHGPALAVYTDVMHPDGRIAFPSVFLELAETGKRVVFCVNDGLGRSYLFEVSPERVHLLQEAASVTFAVEMTYLRFGDDTWTVHSTLPDGSLWMYKTKAMPRDA